MLVRVCTFQLSSFIFFKLLVVNKQPKETLNVVSTHAKAHEVSKDLKGCHSPRKNADDHR